MSAKHAVILAAGLSSRLGAYTSDKPKCLLEVEGKSLLELSLQNLQDVGVRNVCVVTGYLADRIEDALIKLDMSLRLKTIVNSKYATTGSAYSLLLALVDRPASTLVLESDILYHKELLRQAITINQNTVMAAELSGSGDEVYLECNSDQRLVSVSKKPTPDSKNRTIGELAGVTYLTKVGAESYAAYVITNQRVEALHYEEVFLELNRASLPFFVKKCCKPWAEVDTDADLKRARETIWPLLCR